MITLFISDSPIKKGKYNINKLFIHLHMIEVCKFSKRFSLDQVKEVMTSTDEVYRMITIDLVEI